MTTIGVVLFPDFTALDVVGPVEVFSRVPAFDVIYVAESRQPVRAERGGAQIVPDHTFADAPHLDVLFVPGGPGQLAQMPNDALMSFLRATDADRIVSVCTGALLLGGAGLIAGKKATTHWLAMGALRALGAERVAERIVRDGNVWTAAGVSAGIDLALAFTAELAGERVAKAVQLSIEYDPQPPFEAGSPDKAPREIVQLLQERARRFLP